MIKYLYHLLSPVNAGWMDGGREEEEADEVGNMRRKHSPSSSGV